MWQNAHDTYLESRVLSADPVELVGLLYQAATAAVRDARWLLAEGEIAGRSRAISRASAILMELTASLDHSRGGEISVRLSQLYEYMQTRLLEANLQQADGPLAEILGLLTTLSEAWAEVGRQSAPAIPVETPWAQAATAEPVAAHAWSF